MAIMELETVDVAPDHRRDRFDRAATLAVFATLLWWGTEQVIRTGGQDPHVLSYGLLPLIAAFVLVRPWRVLPVVALAAGAAVALAAFGVTWLAPTGGAGADVAASYAYSSGLGLVLLAWASSPGRRQALLGVLAASVGITFAKGWVAWWGSGDPTRPFVGTFYWYNQEGIYLGAGALTALVLLLADVRALRSFAWVVGPCCLAGLILSTSRGSWLVTAVGACVVVAAVAWRTRSARPARIAVIQAGLGVGMWYVISGPPFFSHHASLTGGVADRATRGQTLGHNTGTRLSEWHDGMRVFLHWPWTGTGFHGFAAGTHQVAPHASGLYTAYAHNGVIQAFAEGGLLLGIPLVVALLVLAVGAVRVRTLVLAEPMRLGAFVVLGVLVAHSLIDWDWSYPSLLSAVGLVGAVLLGRDRREAYRARPATGVLALVLLVLLVLAVPAAWSGGIHLSVPLGASS